MVARGVSTAGRREVIVDRMVSISRAMRTPRGSRAAALAVALLAAACGGGGDDAGGDGDGGIDAVDDGAVGDDAAVDAPVMVVCHGAAAGADAGADEVTGGDASTLYQCPGAGQQPTSATPCAAGCVIEPPGTPDHCAVPVTPGGYRLPWRPGVTMRLTQDCNDSCCGDHVGTDEYAYDWANGTGFAIVAARGGTVTHLKINSTTGCGTSGCANDANLIVIDHGDGTQSTYLHLEGGSLAPGVTCGATVTRGQALARAGTTGWSTGLHLHFQVSGVHAGAPTCECGVDGRGCAANTVPWASFWVNATYPSLPITFDEWPDAATCGDRRVQMPASQNQ